MLSVQLDMLQTGAAGAIIYVIGRFLVNRFSIFKKYCIPVPVVGGLLFALIHLCLYQAGILEFSFEPKVSTPTLQVLFMSCFFTSVGFSVGFKLLKKGGISLVIFLFVVAGLIICQDVIGSILAKSFGLDPRLGLAMGSIPLVGGHGTSGAFGPLMEQEYHIASATVVAIAAATYGLISGSIIGGPIARHEVVANNLHSEAGAESGDSSDVITQVIDRERFTNAGLILVASLGIGSLINIAFKHVGISLASYIGPMVIAVIMRNYADSAKKELPMEEINTIGDVSLSLFLSIALMSLKLWQLASLAVPMIVILAIQTVFIAFYAHFVCFRVMGRDYEAAALTTALCGFGLGATPNAMANMKALREVYGNAPKAFFIIPIVGGMFTDFINSFLITVFLNIL